MPDMHKYTDILHRRTEDQTGPLSLSDELPQDYGEKCAELLKI